MSLHWLLRVGKICRVVVPTPHFLLFNYNQNLKLCTQIFWKLILTLETLVGRYDSVLQQFNESVKMCQEQKLLIGQLEDDLRKVNALSVMFRGDAEVWITLVIVESGIVPSFLCSCTNSALQRFLSLQTLSCLLL